MSKLVYHDKLEGKGYIWECMLFSLLASFRAFVLYSKNHNQTLLFLILSKMIPLCRNTRYIFQFCFGLPISFHSWQQQISKTITSHTHRFADQPLRNTEEESRIQSGLATQQQLWIHLLLSMFNNVLPVGVTTGPQHQDSLSRPNIQFRQSVQS